MYDVVGGRVVVCACHYTIGTTTSLPLYQHTHGRIPDCITTIVRLTDTLSVSSYIIIGLLFKQTFGWFSIRHERRYQYYSISFYPFHSIPPVMTGTAGYAAENDSEWKNPYIIYAGNGETPKKIIRKKIKKCVDSRVLRCYTTVVSRGRGTNPGTRDKELEKSSWQQHSKVLQSSQENREQNSGIGAEKVTAIRNLDF